jgi:hypothetical protein
VYTEATNTSVLADFDVADLGKTFKAIKSVMYIQTRQLSGIIAKYVSELDEGITATGNVFGDGSRVNIVLRFGIT